MCDKKEWKPFLSPDTIVFDCPSYESALVGVSHDGRAVYDYDKMVDYLMQEESMSEEDAIDFIDYNTLGALGNQDGYPIVVYLYND